VATAVPFGATISLTTLVLSADVDETSISIRDGALTETGRAASQPPLGTLPEIELVPASPVPA
jgi:hypothetical protein